MKYCQQCGKPLEDHMRFCGACGAMQQASSADHTPKTINLVCSKCSGTMTADKDKGSITCPYCGSTELILESDTVQVEKIRTQAQKDIEFKKMEQEDKVRKEQAQEKKAESIKKRQLPIVLVSSACCLRLYVFPPAKSHPDSFV